MPGILSGWSTHKCAALQSNRRRTVTYLSDYASLLTGSASSAVLSFATSVILARSMGRAEFGVYSAFLALAVLFATLSDVGLTSSYIRYASPLHSRREAESLSFVTFSTLEAKLKFGASIGIVGTAALLVMVLCCELWTYSAVLLAPAAGLALSFFNLTLGAHQMRELFRKYSMIYIVKGLVFLAFVLLVLAVGIRDSVVMSIAYMLTLLVVTFAFWGGVRSLMTSQPSPRDARRLRGVLLSFGKWIAVGTMCFSIFEQVPIASALVLFGPEDTADLSVAVSLIAILSVISIPLSTMVVPQMSRVSGKRDLTDYLAHVYRIIMPITAIVVVLALVFAHSAIELVYGSSYSTAGDLFVLLLIPFVLALIVLPLNTALVYVFNKPSIVATTNVVQLVAIVVSILLFTHGGDIMAFAVVYASIRLLGSAFVASIAVASLSRSTSAWRTAS